MPGDELTRAASRSAHGDDAGRPAARIALTFPARFPSIRLARLVASGVGTELGLDVAAVEDLRLVVDEACAILLECSVVSAAERTGAAGEMLDLDIAWTATEITIAVERPGAITSDIPSSMSVAVLDATATSWAVHHPEARVSLVMTRDQP